MRPVQVTQVSCRGPQEVQFPGEKLPADRVRTRLVQRPCKSPGWSITSISATCLEGDMRDLIDLPETSAPASTSPLPTITTADTAATSTPLSLQP